MTCGRRHSVVFYRAANSRESIARREFESIPPRFQGKMQSKLERVAEGRFREVKVGLLRDGLFEVKVKESRREFRALAWRVGDDLEVLKLLEKKSPKLPANEIETALSRLRQARSARGC